jgi:hypothetical protein
MNVQTVPVPGNHVKVFLRAGLVEEGIVLFWSDAKSVLKSVSSDNVLIIQRTEEDVIAVKLTVEPRNESRAPLDVADTEELKPDRYYKDEKLRAANLAELRILKAQEERQRARDLLTTFRQSGLGPARYGIPRKIQPVPFDPQEETERSHSGHLSSAFLRRHPDARGK